MRDLFQNPVDTSVDRIRRTHLLQVAGNYLLWQWILQVENNQYVTLTERISVFGAQVTMFYHLTVMNFELVRMWTGPLSPGVCAIYIVGRNVLIFSLALSLGGCMLHIDVRCKCWGRL